ncbi:MAG: YggU family protein [Lentisphaerae bacterium]|jgi:uncharacterized protein (TIGR00251 family)|nr:YggU family protein [Lentisphaerota bacterium]
MSAVDYSKYIRASGDGVRIAVHVVPRASRTELCGTYGEDSLKVRLRAPPVDGKANKELARFISKTLGVASRDVQLVSGMLGRDKVVHVSGVSSDFAAAKLESVSK